MTMMLFYVLLEPVLLVYGNESHLLLYGLGSLIHLNVNWLHLRFPYAYVLSHAASFVLP